MRGWSVWLLMLTLVGCVSLGLAQPGGPGGPGGSGGTEEQNFPGTWPFSGSATGSHDGVVWKVTLRASVNCVYSVNGSAPRYVSGGNNHVKDVIFESSSIPLALEFKIIKLEMKIGGIPITQWAPMLPSQHGDINQYKPVRFASAKFAHDTNIEIEVKARFQVRRTDVIGSQWSGELQVVASETVRAYNVGLNWQTTTNQQGVVDTDPDSYPGQAQAAGGAQRTTLGTMNHRVDMSNPTSATASQILQIHVGQATFLMPNTHGDINQVHLTDSASIGASYATMAVKRAEAVANGLPKANMALVMACYSNKFLKEILVGTEEFANFGTPGELWSESYLLSFVPPNGWPDSTPPTEDTSELYIKAMHLMAAGKFANQIPALAETETGMTFTIREGPSLWLPTNLALFGNVTQRPKHVYISQTERTTMESQNRITVLWYLVVDPSDYRGGQ